jgi:surface antigen
VIKKIFSFFFSSLFLAGCAGGPNQMIGGVGGGAIGGLLGSQIGKGRGRLFSTGIGVLVGALLGSKIGAELDDNDKKIIGDRTTEALESKPSGYRVDWDNPDTFNRGYIIPQSTSYDELGRPCRRFTQVAWIDGRKVEVHGMAYRGRDGSWHMVQ